MACVTLSILDLRGEAQQESNICTLNLVTNVEVLKACVKPLTLFFNEMTGVFAGKSVTCSAAL